MRTIMVDSQGVATPRIIIDENNYDLTVFDPDHLYIVKEYYDDNGEVIFAELYRNTNMCECNVCGRPIHRMNSYEDLYSDGRQCGPCRFGL